MLANMSPGIIAAGSTSNASGESTSPQAMMMTRMYAVEMRARVAPHRISPVITSSMLTGVAIIGSHVRWVGPQGPDGQDPRRDEVDVALAAFQVHEAAQTHAQREQRDDRLNQRPDEL